LHFLLFQFLLLLTHITHKPIDLFKRTGSITKLQSAMGHSSMKVSLTYLRGLEVPELTEEDMPAIEL
jgi:hypothetical protein